MFLIRIVRTGQPHRTLLGHTGPVTCLQFDELHVVSGSLDKTVRVSVCRHIFLLCRIYVIIDMGPPYRWNGGNPQI